MAATDFFLRKESDRLWNIRNVTLVINQCLKKGLRMFIYFSNHVLYCT